MLEQICYQSKLFLKRNSPTILTFIGAAGVGITAFMAARATPKAMIFMNQAENDKGEKLTKIEIIQTVGVIYIPTVIVGLSTITCIFRANALNKRQQATLASAYAFLSQAYKRYRTAANAVYGEDADSKIQAEMARETYISADGIALYDPELDTLSEKVLFYEPISNRYFKSTMPAVIQAEYHTNRNFVLRGGASLNEFYEFLGIDRMGDAFDNMGWGDKFLESGFIWIDFEHQYTKLEDGMDCYIISTAAVDDECECYVF